MQMIWKRICVARKKTPASQTVCMVAWQDPPMLDSRSEPIFLIASSVGIRRSKKLCPAGMAYDNKRDGGTVTTTDKPFRSKKRGNHIRRFHATGYGDQPSRFPRDTHAFA
uniref:Uncharacterized protein n=1 Tax=Sphaerodactylus townsendi TaxID=933632 RepID=A0ACB8ELP5_9SAUR